MIPCCPVRAAPCPDGGAVRRRSSQLEQEEHSTPPPGSGFQWVDQKYDPLLQSKARIAQLIKTITHAIQLLFFTLLVCFLEPLTTPRWMITWKREHFWLCNWLAWILTTTIGRLVCVCEVCSVLSILIISCLFGEGILPPHCTMKHHLLSVYAQAAGRGDGRDRLRRGASHPLRAGNLNNYN